MTCPACHPKAPCSACVAEGAAKTRGRPKLPYKPERITLWVHPKFPSHLRRLAAAENCSQGEAVQRACQFKPNPTSK